MTDPKTILRKAQTEQRAGRAGNSIKLRILAAEVKTMRFGEDVKHV